MERRLLLAIVLTFAVLTVYQWLVPMSQPAPATQTAAPNATVPEAQPPAGATAPPPPAAPAPAQEPPPAVETVQADTAERTITVDNGVVRAIFSNRGATLMAWELLAYMGPNGKPVDLVPHDVPPNQPKPFSLKLDDAAKSARLNSALFASTSSGSLNAVNAPATIAFEYQDAAGLHARKQFSFKPNSYEVIVTDPCDRRRAAR